MKAKSRSRSVLISADTSAIASSAATPTSRACHAIRAGAKAVARTGKAASSAVRTVVSRVAHLQAEIDKRISEVTGIELDWTSSTITIVSAGGCIRGRHRVRSWAQRTLHDKPGHLRWFQDINEFIDLITGKHHRIKHGHSIEWLPEIVKRFGLRGIPGFAAHLLQDLTTVAGIPWLPFPRLIKCGLRRWGLSSAAATSCVTVNLAGVIAAVGAGLIILEVGGVAYAIYGKLREKQQKRNRPQELTPQQLEVLAQRPLTEVPGLLAGGKDGTATPKKRQARRTRATAA